MRHVWGLGLLLLCGCSAAPTVAPERAAAGSSVSVEVNEPEPPVLEDRQYDRSPAAGAAEDLPSELSAQIDTDAAQGLSALPDGSYVLTSLSKRIADSERYDYQEVRFEKSGDYVVGELAFYLDENPCIEGTVAGDRIVDMQLVYSPYAGDSWQGPDSTDLVIDGSEYRVASVDEGGGGIDFCKEGFALLRTSTDEGSDRAGWVHSKLLE